MGGGQICDPFCCLGHNRDGVGGFPGEGIVGREGWGGGVNSRFFQLRPWRRVRRRIVLPAARP